jgi:Leucine-rich repeat (LRR) protein
MLRKAGAKVTFDWESPEGNTGSRPNESPLLRTLFGDYYDVDRINKVDFSNCRPTTKDFRQLSYCRSAKIIDIRKTPFSDADCKLLRDMPKLETLCACRTEITDKATEYLAQCKNLKNLDLSGCQVSDQAIYTLSKSRSLTSIGLDQTLVTGESLRYLSKMQSIQIIRLCGRPVSNADLKPLAECQSLSNLDLSDTNITIDALPELARIKGLKILTVKRTKLSRSIDPNELSRRLPGVAVFLVGNG